MSFQKVFCESLAALELRRCPVGSENGKPTPLKLVDEPQNEWQLGADYRQTYVEIFRDVRDFDDIGRVDGDTVGNRCDPSVAGSTVELAHVWALFELPGKRVLPPAAADQEHSQGHASVGVFKVNVINNLRNFTIADYPTAGEKVSTIRVANHGPMDRTECLRIVLTELTSSPIMV